MSMLVSNAPYSAKVELTWTADEDGTEYELGSVGPDGFSMKGYIPPLHTTGVLRVVIDGHVSTETWCKIELADQREKCPHCNKEIYSYYEY